MLFFFFVILSSASNTIAKNSAKLRVTVFTKDCLIFISTNLKKSQKKIRFPDTMINLFYKNFHSERDKLLFFFSVILSRACVCEIARSPRRFSESRSCSRRRQQIRHAIETALSALFNGAHARSRAADTKRGPVFLSTRGARTVFTFRI